MTTLNQAILALDAAIRDARASQSHLLRGDGRAAVQDIVSAQAAVKRAKKALNTAVTSIYEDLAADTDLRFTEKKE